MSDETPDKSAAPGSTASDDAPTAEVPRIPRPDKEPAAPAKPSIASAVRTISNAVSGDKASDNGGDAGSKDETKVTMTERIAAAVPSSLRNPKPVVTSTPGSGPGVNKVDGVTAASRPITAGEYARTTTPSAATTALIPVVKDEARQPSSGAAAAASAASGRQASLKLVRVDPWSVTKVTFALTVALMIVAVVAVTILWIVLSFAGIWDQINSSVTTVLSDDSSSFDITDYLGLGRIVGLTLVISSINVIITTAVATIGAYLYNLAAQLLGGVDVTLAEDD